MFCKRLIPTLKNLYFYRLGVICELSFLSTVFLAVFLFDQVKENNWCLLLPLVMDGIMIRHCLCLSNFSLGSSSHLSTSWAQILTLVSQAPPWGSYRFIKCEFTCITSLLKSFFPPGFSGHQPPPRCAPVCHVLCLLHYQVVITSLFNVA